MTEEYDIDSSDLFSGVEEAKGIDSEASEITIEKRPRGILSNTDREYIFGLQEYKHPQSEANRKQDIRERVVNALHDFSILCFLHPEEREKIFHEEIDEDALHQCLEAMISFGFLGLDQDEDRFETIIENGVYLGANLDKNGRWVGEATNVDASIEIDYNPDIDALYRRLKEEDVGQLTPAEIGVLAQAGRLEPDDLEKLQEREPIFPQLSLLAPLIAARRRAKLEKD